MKLFDNSGSAGSQIRMNCTTAVQFYSRQRVYTAGQVGTTDSWVKFRSVLDQTIVNGTVAAETAIDVFWADWQGSYGSQQVQAMSMGVYDLCTLRMDYHPDLYALLRTKEVLIIKNAAADAVSNGVPIRSHPDVYTLWGAVDDIRNARKIMEFKVRRWEGK